MNKYWKTVLEVDKRFRSMNVPYCVVKCYGGLLEFYDENVDVVVSGPLRSVYKKMFRNDSVIAVRDMIKNYVYERNKLMLSPMHGNFVKIHLHRNLGWHDLCFISSEKIFSSSIEVQLESRNVWILPHCAEAQSLIFHIIFEKFKKNLWDDGFLTLQDYVNFAKEFDLPEKHILMVKRATGEIEFSELRSIWLAYYRARKKAGKLSLRNIVLHMLFVVIQMYRRNRQHNQDSTALCSKNRSKRNREI